MAHGKPIEEMTAERISKLSAAGKLSPTLDVHEARMTASLRGKKVPLA